MAAQRGGRRGPEAPTDKDQSVQASHAARVHTSRRFRRRAERQKGGSERLRIRSETEPTCPVSRMLSFDARAVSNCAKRANQPQRVVAKEQDPFALRLLCPHDTIFMRLDASAWTPALGRQRLDASAWTPALGRHGLRCCVSKFKAIVVEQADGRHKASLTDFDEAQLMEGDVTVRVEWSTVNYKDGLAITGKTPVIRRFPMIAGIDLAGTVESSSHPQWKRGDRVVLNGWGLGETHFGGYAEKARVKGHWLVGLPARNSLRGAMAIGTAGFTAMLAVMALEYQGITPQQG